MKISVNKTAYAIESSSVDNKITSTQRSTFVRRENLGIYYIPISPSKKSLPPIKRIAQLSINEFNLVPCNESPPIATGGIINKIRIKFDAVLAKFDN